MLFRRLDKLREGDRVHLHGQTYRVETVGSADLAGHTGIVLIGLTASVGQGLAVTIEAVWPNDDLIEVVP